MKLNQKGFTFVELIITMVVFMFVIVAASNIFSSLLGQFKQQSRIAESNIEGIIGLEMLRADIEQAGYGLPWNLNSAAYTEAGQIATPYSTPWFDRDFNDGPPTNPARGVDTAGSSNPPGGIRSGNAYNSDMPAGCSTNPSNASHCSDVLVIKATNIATNDTVKKWTYVLNTAAGNVFQTSYNVADEALKNNDRVIVIRPATGTSQRILQLDTSATPKFYANFRADTTTRVPDMVAFEADTSVAINADFLPEANTFLAYIFYGITPSTANPRMPFNRADYYIRRPATGMPSQCAPNTGILYKAVLSNDTAVALDGVGGTPRTTELPLLDCVYDMQVVFALDTDADGIVNSPPSQDINTLTATNIRDQLKEVRVYILAHEGQYDSTYTYTNPNNPPVTGCTGASQICINDVGGVGLIKAVTVPSRNYRWKIYTLVVTPFNLR